MNLRNDLFIDILYASLAIVGFGSTGYHWYGNIGWALFDEMPIIITIFSGLLYTDNVYYLTYNNKYAKEGSENDLLITNMNANVNANTDIVSVNRKWNIARMYNKKYRILLLM